MKTIYLKNFRKGFATNSSSTHSVIYRNKDDMFNDLNVFEMDYYDRFDSTIAASKAAKIKYIAANIMWNKKLFEIMCAFYPEMKQYEKPANNQRERYFNRSKSGEYDDKFGMCARGPLYFSNNSNIEASIDYLRNVIDDEDIIIVGGSDEQDFVYDTIEGHKKLSDPDDIEENSKFSNKVVKNGNYWIGYGWHGKLRFKTEKGNCIPEYPELIDLKITNNCDHGCKFCYMDSNSKGKHADIKELEKIINQLSTGYKSHYDKRVEFSIGGGNVLLYPQLGELFKFIKDKGHIINTTINAKDVEKLVNDKEIHSIFTNYVSGIGISVSDDKDVEILSKFKNASFIGDDYRQVVIHMIPELLGVEKTRELVKKLNEHEYYNVLFLGYKTNGRGSSQKSIKFTNDDLNKLFDELHCTSVDTTFANTYREWLDDNFETTHTITLHEGEYSMYIDGVEGIAYKSSYQLDKPYNLKYTNWDEHLTKWFNPIEAFSNIRKDNGFKVYGEKDS